MASDSPSTTVPAGVIADIRSVVLSNKEGVKVTQFAHDFKGLVGQPLEFQKYGYSSLNHLLEDLTDVVR